LSSFFAAAAGTVFGAAFFVSVVTSGWAQPDPTQANTTPTATHDLEFIAPR
jgi:hypothetical protein